MILSLSMQEEALLKKYMDNFTADWVLRLNHSGAGNMRSRAVPDNLFSELRKEICSLEMLDSLGRRRRQPGGLQRTSGERAGLPPCPARQRSREIIQNVSAREAHALIDELLTLENPYNCPHGRPTIISMSKYELEKKFKTDRIMCEKQYTGASCSF